MQSKFICTALVAKLPAIVVNLTAAIANKNSQKEQINLSDLKDDLNRYIAANSPIPLEVSFSPGETALIIALAEDSKPADLVIPGHKPAKPEMELLSVEQQALIK